MNFSEFLKHNTVYLDGGMGTLLQDRGLTPGELPERWNITHPDIICDIHKAYFDAGSNVITANTFGANALKFDDAELEEVISAALSNARRAKNETFSPQEKFIALDIGPSGKLLAPLGDLDFEDAVNLFAKTARLGAKHGADLVIIETMNDSYETKAALLAVKESCDLPVIVSNAYGEDSKLMTGATPEAMVSLLEGMGADAVGANCSLGPHQLRGVMEKLLSVSSIPVVFQPNAGIPKSVSGKTVFDVDADEFSDEVCELVKLGVRVVGGCCGTTPEYISKVVEKTNSIAPATIADKNLTVISSYTHAVTFGDHPILIGERINPTGKKRFKQALLENDMSYILAEGVNQQERGVHVLDVNVGIPDINERQMLADTVCELQAIINLPLQIDTSNFDAMENALRRYNGKAMINSVNGKEESMHTIFPLVKKYGGVVVALTLDENGIPETADGRFEIAKKILSVAERYRIDKNDIIFDTLAMAISADSTSAIATLNSLRRIKDELGVHTLLGVSNVSFGLPNRDAINGTFFALALENGLSAAIMNPYSADMMRTYYTYRALKGLDANCADYISVAENFTTATAQATALIQNSDTNCTSELRDAIIRGLHEKAGQVCASLLEQMAPLDIVTHEIIPSLDTVGRGFENKTVYLPQLLMSAEAAKSAFEKIKGAMQTGDNNTPSKAKLVLATVRGDIHDIGKNIVKLLLENYGYDVVDLGRDVAPEKIVEKVCELSAPYVGLSALMTTTVPAMEETIKLLRKSAPWCKVIVGGAVLTPEYADRIGADFYEPDAMSAVRRLEEMHNLGYSDIEKNRN